MSERWVAAHRMIGSSPNTQRCMQRASRRGMTNKESWSAVGKRKWDEREEYSEAVRRWGGKTGLGWRDGRRWGTPP